MAESNEEPRKPSADRLDTRRIRGLSQRLRKPLTLDANTLEEEGEPTLLPEEELQTRQVHRLDTRQVAPPPSAEAKRVVTEGLLTEGTQLQNRYKILGVIGVGGMGAVYKAQDLRFANVQRLCAVKEMINTATDLQVQQMIIRNFEREASILATLSHPAIPQVYDYFTEGKRSYLVLEFIPGQDLEALLADADGFFRESRVVDWAVQLCDVLSYLHNHKPRPIIFRDLKPSNIMLDPHGRIRLVDFGIAKLFQSGEKGTMIGTEGYSPPEQYRGIAEPRGDLYALGATLHHLLSKQDPRLEPPFSFHERPIHKTNPTVTRQLVEVLDKALEYDINKRWGSSEELKRALLSLPTARGLTASIAQGETAAFSEGSVKPLWRFACEDEVRAGVGLGEGLVFVPSYDHNVYALEAQTGKFVWKYPTEGGIASTPWVGDGSVIFGSTDGVLYAVNARSGRLVWTVPLKGKIYSSPYVDFGHVFVGSDGGFLYAVHVAGGRKAWQYQAEGQVRTRPLLSENMIFFACDAGMVYALSLNRDLRWRFRARRAILSSPVFSEGLLFVGSLDWNFYGLDVRSGWTAWRYRTGGPVVSTPAVWEQQVFFGSTDGYVYALDATNGRLVWRYEIGEQVTGSPVVHDDGLYIGGVNGMFYCLDARTGNVRWSYQTDGGITATPVIADNIVYIGSLDHYVYAFPA